MTDKKRKYDHHLNCNTHGLILALRRVIVELAVDKEWSDVDYPFFILESFTIDIFLTKRVDSC